MDYKTIMLALAREGLTEAELKAKPINYSPKGDADGFIWHQNVLRERGWQFTWNARRWAYLMSGADLLGVELYGHWASFTPPWTEILTDLREVTGYKVAKGYQLIAEPIVDGHLLPVAE